MWVFCWGFLLDFLFGFCWFFFVFCLVFCWIFSLFFCWSYYDASFFFAAAASRPAFIFAFCSSLKTRFTFIAPVLASMLALLRYCFIALLLSTPISSIMLYKKQKNLFQFFYMGGACYKHSK